LHRFEEKLVAATLPSMQLILLREDTSMALLRRLGVSANTRRAIDSGFLFDSPHQANLRARLSLPAHTLLLGVTVRSWLKGDQQVAYETAVAGALDAVTKTAPVHVVFIPQVTAAKGDDDRVTSRRVYQLMQAKHSATLVEEELTHYDVKAMYNDLDLLLGTRFHSVIFSLTAYVPVMAIEYEHKTSGIMKDLDLSEWVTKIEDVTATNLTAALQRLLTEREDYVVHLRRRLPTYQTQARQAAELLHRAYLAHTLGRNDVVEVNEGTASEGAAR
jgi:colanic acid/amylovoran biosynthesis protein